MSGVLICKDKQKIWKLKSFLGLLTSIQFLSTMRFTINVFQNAEMRRGRVFFFLNTDSTDQRDYVACTRDWNLYNPENLCFFFLNTESTKRTEYIKTSNKLLFYWQQLPICAIFSIFLFLSRIREFANLFFEFWRIWEGSLTLLPITPIPNCYASSKFSLSH